MAKPIKIIPEREVDIASRTHFLRIFIKLFVAFAIPFVLIAGINAGLIADAIVSLVLTIIAVIFRGDESRWEEMLADLPFGRQAEAGEVADLILFCASDRASYLSGTVIDVDGGALYR